MAKDKNKKTSIIRILKYFKLKILRISGEPSKIALSFAVGSFIGVMPTFGIASFLSIGVASVFKLNILACVFGSWVSNPWTAPFFYTSSYKLGEFLFKKFPFLLVHLHFIHNGTKIFKIMIFGQKLILGAIIVSSIIAIVSYYVILKTIQLYRYEKALRREKRKNSK